MMFLIAAPILVTAWILAFLLTPDIRPIRSIADAYPVIGLAALVAAAWWAMRWFLSGDRSARFQEMIGQSPKVWGSSVLFSASLFPLVLCMVGKYYWIHIGAIALIYVILGIGLNIVVGFSGLLVLGFSAFYGIGAYLAAILTTRYQALPHLIWLILPLAALVAAFFGLVLGAPTLRLRGDYLAIVTMGFGEIVRIVFTNWDGLTMGPRGISGVAPFAIGGWDLSNPLQVGPIRFDGAAQYYYLFLSFAAFAALVAYRLNQSRIGRAWVAMREDELAARCFGIDTTRYKLLAFSIAASFAGVAGVFFASLQGFVDPTSFTFLESVMILCAVVLGGMGSISGAVVAASILSTLR